MVMLFPFFVYAKEEVTFSKCVDGDTIKVKVKNKEATVRMLAVDTPESVHPKKIVEYYGKEASDYTCNLITNAKKIELEYDTNSDNNFLTYAVWWIRKYVKDYHNVYDNIVKRPNANKHNLYVPKARRWFENKYHREPTNEELIEILHKKYNYVKKIIKLFM